MNRENIVLSLIKDHIRHTRLTNGLYNTGFDTDNLVLNLGSTIFNIMGLGNDNNSDEAFSRYLEIVDKISAFERDEWVHEVEPLAREAYALLLVLKGREGVCAQPG